MTSPQPAPGWYPDPTGGPAPKYWDGRQWNTPPPPSGVAPYGVPGFGLDINGRPLSDKSKVVAALLQIFLGGFGIGRFYLGYTMIGVLQIVVTVLTLGLGALWGFVDGIVMLVGHVTDAQGRTLRD